MSEQNYPRYDHNDPREPVAGPRADGGHPYAAGSTPRHDAYPAPHDGAAQPPHAPHRPDSEPGFLATLFDLDFKHFITIKFAKFIYVLSIALSALGGLIMVISGLVALTESAAGLLFVIFGLVSVLINIVLMRVFLEFVISMIRTAQNTTALVERR